jgi:hypothetical protein
MVSSTKIPNYPQSYPQDVEMRGLWGDKTPQISPACGQYPLAS